MAFMGRKREKEEDREMTGTQNFLDMDASMQGSLTFRDPVNLCINGKFEGSLDTKGNLTIGENAQVHANITGENIIISGKVFGNILASGSLKLTATAYILGDVSMSRLSIEEGAVLQGKCQMEVKQQAQTQEKAKVNPDTIKEALMTVDELAKYLEVDADSVLDWAKTGKIPAQRVDNNWKFDRLKVDSWIASEKIERK
jgi:excisionase family DNA binding protein